MGKGRCSFDTITRKNLKFYQLLSYLVVKIEVLHRTYFETFLLSDDQTRVKLRRGSGDYINANFVNVRKKLLFVKAVLSFCMYF